MSRRFAALVALLLLCLACDRRETADSPATRTSPAVIDDGRPQDGGTLVRRLDTDVATLNPVIHSNISDRYVADYLFTPMIHLDQDLEPIPGLADAWDIEDGGKLYRFQLNRKATFSDGTPVKASDVLFTLRKIVDPLSEALQIAGVFEQVDLARTRAVDDHTVEIAFRQPLASQLLRFNDFLVIPEHVYGKGNFRKDYNATAVGSGPYRLVRREADREIVLQRRDDYWGDRPPIETVIFRVIIDQSTAWNAVKRGDIDETRVPSDLWQRERDNAQLAKTLAFQRFYTLSFNFISWNTRNPRLSDKRVRRALAMCIPVDSIIKEMYAGTARAMSGPFTPDDFAYNPNVPVVRYDPAGAKQLLTSAGWLDSDRDGIVDQGGKPLQVDLLVMSGAATTMQFAQTIQAEMKKIGVDLEIVTMESAGAIERILAGNYEAAYLSFDLDADPDPFAILHSSQIPRRGQNFSYYRNAEVDRLITAARSELDRSKRRDLYWRLHEIVADEQPSTWLFQVSSKWAINRRVRGVELSRGYGLYRWYPGPLAWWIPRDMRGTAVAPK
ncbi:MAG TPA: ABC transporter substrate-binding protein [Gemmatimonadaceae bacterium]|nr:ABC transporter substrate-binding protein [Gemmatimonadaceae bacterium]